MILEDGSESDDPIVIMTEWQNVFSKLFSNQEPGSLTGFDDELYEYIITRKELLEKGEIDTPNGQKDEVLGDIIDDPIRKEEVEMLVRRSKAGRTCGIDSNYQMMSSKMNSLSPYYTSYLTGAFKVG